MTTASIVALGIIGLALATMPVYAVVARGRPPDEDVQRRPATLLLGRWIRGWLMWLIGPLERAFVRWNVSPDAFNIAGAALGLAAGVAYACGSAAGGGGLLLLGGLADIFDGRVARARSLVSPYGELLDSSLDRFAETFAYAGLAVALVHSRIGVLCAVLALGGSMLVSYVRARGQGLGVDYRGGLMQRAERLVLLAVASLLDDPVRQATGWPPYTLVLVTLGVIGIGSFGTAVHRLVWTANELKRRGRADERRRE